MEEDKSNRGRKTNEIVQNDQINRAFELILYKRLSFEEFRLEYSKEVGVTTRQASDVWKKVKELIKQRYADERDQLLENQIHRYYDLLERSRRDKNKVVERQVLQDLSKLYGLDTQKVDITSGGEKLSINIVLNKD